MNDAKNKTCEWVEKTDSDYWWADVWTTGCGHRNLNPCENSPGYRESKEHVFKFCPFCGLTIAVKMEGSAP